jgi:NAD(P)-dependent dehydrogenase (short-subunit alcohol dehydrogenase family)
LLLAETVSLAIELKPKGITIVAITPGWVSTDMGNAPVSVIDGIKGPQLDATTSVKGMLSFADSLTIEQTGCYVNYEHNIVPF